MIIKRTIITDKVIRDVLLNTLLESLTSAYNFLASLFGGFIILFSFFHDSIDFELWQSIIIGIVIYIIIFGAIFNIKAVKNFAKVYYQANEFNLYGETIITLSAAFSIIHELERSNIIDFYYIMNRLESFCSVIQGVFHKLTGYKCSVSIKIHVEELNNEDPTVITLCRDIETTKNGEREKRNGSIKHFISQNSCFQHFYINIGKKRGRSYLNNNIVMDLNYKNTSFEFYDPKPTSVDPEIRTKEWPLPYKSELVVPIKLNEEDDNSSLIGFLCVDCEEINVFNKKYDPSMTIGIAEGIYNVLKKYKELGTLN